MAKSTLYAAKQPDADGFIHYNEAEHSVWSDLFNRQITNVEKYCAEEYLHGLHLLPFDEKRIPQCSELSEVLRDLTGWQIAPVPALIGFREFFDMLANKTFPAASFIRSRRDFDYIEEPDIFHEIFGHTPLLTDQRFADFSQAIGRAGINAAPKDYSWIIRLYWFTIEFGLKRQVGSLKALGSGLASSPTELPYSVNSDVAERKAFDLTTILRTPYRIDIFQPIYFVLDELDDLFGLAERDLLNDVHQAQKLGLFKPTYDTLDAVKIETRNIGS